ncbi:MAG: sugar phosphate isomerase/epimerase family protein [Patescibacteria group bacterium]|nr:sugar phosphate isomerase/epimerase family protein [Patescibacteria group bacterium]
MARPVTLVSGQWSDLTLDTLAEKAAGWGYDGLELACRKHFLDVDRAATDPKYCQDLLALFERHKLGLWAISAHAAGQLACDPNDDARTDVFAPPEYSGDGEAKRHWAVEALKQTARAARNLGVDVITGFTGSPMWHLLYRFPPVPEETIRRGFAQFAETWNPILDVFDECGVRFAFEVHPTEIAFDIVTARRAIKAVGNRPTFGFNFDPSHLIWQGMDPVCFLKEFPDRIYHVHMKDAAVTLDGRTGILGSNLRFGHPRRGWDFRSLGHGNVDFEAIIRVLNHIGYQGPLSVEWEDSGMDREHGAPEALEFVRQIDFPASAVAFDAAFAK